METKFLKPETIAMLNGKAQEIRAVTAVQQEQLNKFYLDVMEVISNNSTVVREEVYSESEKIRWKVEDEIRSIKEQMVKLSILTAIVLTVSVISLGLSFM